MEEIIDDFQREDRSEQHYKLASMGQRFANYVIDRICLLIFGFILAVIIEILNPGLLAFEVEDDLQYRLVEYGISAILVLLYYSFVEYILKGKTIGKFFTKTRTVTEDNNQLDFGTTVKRSFCRLIPFEAFSFLGSDNSGWHDTLSDTKVIEDVGWKI